MLLLRFRKLMIDAPASEKNVLILDEGEVMTSFLCECKFFQNSRQLKFLKQLE